MKRLGTGASVVLSCVLGLIVGCGPKEEEPAPPAEINVSGINGFTSEQGDQAGLSVVLGTKPSADVVISVVSTDTGEGTVDKSELVFTPEDFDVEQQVIVTGANDDVDDGNQGYKIDLAVTSEDIRYAELSLSSLDVVNVDDDTAGINVSAISGATSELGDPATFDVVLTSQPTAEVTVTLDTSDPNEGTPDVLSVTFTESTWDAPQTVTISGVDDDLADGVSSYAIVFGATLSDDPVYAAMTPASIPVTNVDDESAGILVTSVSGPTTEAAGTATFTVELTSQPLDDVTVSLSSSNTAEGMVDLTDLTFTDADWFMPQTVTVTGQDDDVDDGDQPYSIDFNAAMSNDPDYDAMQPAALAVTNVDDDQAGITVSPALGAATEGGGQATFTVVLDSQPLNDVDLTFDTDDPGEGMPDVTSMTFTDTDWFMPQTVTVTGQDDPINDGYQSFHVVFDAVSSTDPLYGGMSLADVSLVNVDDDITGIIVSEPSGNTTEAAGTATFDVVLAKQPTDTVTLTFDTSNNAEGIPDVTSLAFDDTDWDIPKTVTVTGQDDALDDGDQTYTIDFDPVSSADPFFSGIPLASVTLINEDDEGPSLVGYYDMSAGNGVAAQEAGILSAGYNATSMTDLTAADLAGIDMLVVQNPSNSAYGSEYTSNFSDIDAAVFNGMVLVIHDRYVTGAASILPGGDMISMFRSTTADINVADDTTAVTDGPGGTIDDTTLDGGNSSAHGYATEASLPAGGLNILSHASGATDSVTFSYPYGSGAVVYSTIPLDYYLGGNGPSTVQANMADVYYPNVVYYAGTEL